MSRRIATFLMLNVVLALGLVTTLVAQAPAPAPGAAKAKAKIQPGKQVAARPGLFFKEAWKQNEGGSEQHLTQANVSNPDLEVKSVCVAGEGVLMTGFDNNDANPTHTWNGTCETSNMFTLRHKTKVADLTGQARVKVISKTSGFHTLRLVVKNMDGAWMIADRLIGSPTDWLTEEFAVSDLKWLRLDAAKVLTKGTILPSPELGAIDEIGIADLMPGSGHGAGGWADVAQIEVYANSKPRE
jgi:hypothetical protein